MSAAEQVAIAEVALRDRQAEVERAETLYRNNASDQNWALRQRALVAASRAELDLRLAKEAVEREIANANATEKRELVAKVREEGAIVDAWTDKAIPLSREIAERVRALAPMLEQLGHFTIAAQQAAVLAKTYAEQAGIRPDHGQIPTEALARALVRAQLEGLAVDVGEWTNHLRPHWQRDPEARGAWDQARRLLGLDDVEQVDVVTPDALAAETITAATGART